MMEWFEQNKTWVFSGIGCTIITSVIGFIVWFFRRRHCAQSQKSGRHSTNMQAGGDITIGELQNQDGRRDD